MEARDLMSTGSQATLHRASASDRESIGSLIDANAPRAPIAGTAMRRQSGYGSRPWRYYDIAPSVSIGTSASERIIRSLRHRLNNELALPPQIYVAVLSENPGLDLGGHQYREVEGFHLLVGYY